MFYVKTSKSGISFEISLFIWDAKESISHLLKCYQCHLCSLLYNIHPTLFTTLNLLSQNVLSDSCRGGAPFRTASLQRAIQLAYTARRFKLFTYPVGSKLELLFTDQTFDNGWSCRHSKTHWPKTMAGISFSFCPKIMMIFIFSLRYLIWKGMT